MESQFVVATAAMAVTQSKEENLGKYVEFIDRASAVGARLLVFPEVSLQGYLSSTEAQLSKEELERLHSNAELVPGPSTELLAKLSRERNLYIAFGMVEKVAALAGTRLYNAAVLIGPEGLVGVHRKIHLIGNERDVFSPGHAFSTFSTNVGRIGILICRDQAFPEANRVLALQGAEIMLLIAAWGAPWAHRYDVFTRSRAMENQRWYVTSNQVGTWDGSLVTYMGRSRIIDPEGQVLAETPEDREALAHTQVDIQTALQEQFKGPEYNLRRRMPSTYTHLLAEWEALPTPGE